MLPECGATLAAHAADRLPTSHTGRAPEGVDASALDAVLERGLTAHFGRPRRILSISARPVDTFSSHPISRLSVVLDGGERLETIFKRLQPAPGKIVRREVITYERLLAGSGLEAPALYGSECDDRQARYWLLTEDVGEWRLTWCAIDGWMAAARWLAGMHAAYDGSATHLRALGCLAEHDEHFYQSQAATARASLQRFGHPAALERFDCAMGRFDALVSFLVRQPRTLLHGDISGPNLMVQPGHRIRPIDWEWAAVGPGAWDVVKLTAGWGGAKPHLLKAYIKAFERRSGSALDRTAFHLALSCCGVIKTLWYLRWWTAPCREPAFVDRLLDKTGRTVEALTREVGDA